MYKIGFDIGSTTIKTVVLNDNNEICYKSYERHKSNVRQKTLDKLNDLKEFMDSPFMFAMSGSSALGICDEADLPFVQEVFAESEAIKQYNNNCDVAIELGGEDAKILFFDGAIEQRMNSSCAGGTGAFIDQMASLLNVEPKEMNELAKNYKKIYPIASRCGVFAKTDIQPLINQGVSKEDLSASIFQAVVDQTIASLAQGREIKGNIMFLGGPLYFLSALRDRFIQTLGTSITSYDCPDTAIHFVAYGSALCADKQLTYNELYTKLSTILNNKNNNPKINDPLFKDKNEYDEFIKRHKQSDVKTLDLKSYVGNAYIGIDSGSTTTKLVVISDNNDLLYDSYNSNKGNPLDIVLDELKNIYKINPNIVIKGAYSTGYGEELMKTAFHLDGGIVETVAHFTAAKYFNPNVDYILDIGGQDMKCFKIRDNQIDDIILNEACSSGCGSFIETFAKSLGYNSIDFANLALKSQNPVDLGTRCTVFMNSGVKQAQKNGASIEDISAGLCKSVVKNALYKVLHINNAKELGENIVVQGGTFKNNAILRLFEKEIKHNVIRSNIAHLMGAFGAALYAKSLNLNKSNILSYDELLKFKHSSRSTNCQGCTNHCSLTINTFTNNEVLIAGNKCDKMIKTKKNYQNLPDLYNYELEELSKYKFNHQNKIGIPMVLNMYDLLPFYSTFFDALNIEAVYTKPSTIDTYRLGQSKIPSDTACFPAKLVHGHIQQLIDQNIKTIFYPCMTYNIDEKQSDNHYNCPLVAYYPHVIEKNTNLDNITYLSPFLSFDHLPSFYKTMQKCLKTAGYKFSIREIKSAYKKGWQAYQNFHYTLKEKHLEAVEFARSNNLPIVVLCGRPYHLDPLVNHQIHKLLTDLGFVVLSENSCPKTEKQPVNVLNQWTYHARLYQAAKYVSQNKDMQLVQLVSFGCGIDAITTDEIRDILKQNNKLYTQIKIDEIDNLGAAKIRLRSLKAAIKQRGDLNE